MRVGIDASNIRKGGGVTHLVELLYAGNPQAHGFEQVIIWAGSSTLSRVPDRPWLVKSVQAVLDKSLPYRALWQRFRLSNLARMAKCDVLFVPGGSYAGDFHPMVTMSQNLLPFEWRELLRYGWSLMTLKMMLLRWTQSRTFRRAEGLILLDKYAQDVVMRLISATCGKTTIIPHGISERFRCPAKKQLAIDQYSLDRPLRIIYVSIVEVYKHQWQVAEGVALLRKRGFPVVLDLVGPAYPPALKRLRKTLDRIDPAGEFVQYSGAIPHDELHTRYARADLCVFASSCENMPNILIEAMAAGLPVACSNRGPMPEVLGNAGVYFDPEDSISITSALETMLADPILRARCATDAFYRANQYSWDHCANQTFSFLAETALRHST